MDETRDINQLIKQAQSSDYQVCIWGAGYIGRGFGLNILKQLNICVDYYCDNNQELFGKEIVDGIMCEDFQKLIDNREYTVCFLIMRSDYIGEVYKQINSLGIKNIVTYQDLLEMDDIVEGYYPFMSKRKIAVYTCIVGDYDQINNPEFVSDDCDYYLISDKRPDKETIFQYLDIENYLPLEIADNTRKNRYVKINAHKIFPQYRYSIYVDGNIVITDSMKECIENLPRTKMAVAGESYWDSIYVEGIRCIESNRDKKEVILKQVERYWLEGMPKHFCSFLCNVLVREHNHPNCVQIMKDWWTQVAEYSKRDQISFPYVLWKNGYTKDDVKTLAPKPGFISDYWTFIHEHNKSRMNV